MVHLSNLDLSLKGYRCRTPHPFPEKTKRKRRFYEVLIVTGLEKFYEQL